MKNIFKIFLFFFFHHCSFSQNSILFLDSITHEKINNVSIYSLKYELISISNENGLANLNNNESLNIKCFGYKNLSYLSLKLHDTVYLTPKFKLLNDITIKPLNIPEFYNKILDSSRLTMNKNYSNKIYGNYFESLLVINQISGDSSVYSFVCPMIIESTKIKKKFLYEIKIGKAKKTIKSKEKTVFDTNFYKNNSLILSKFSTFLKYDFSNLSLFKVNFKNKKNIRNQNSFFVFDSTGAFSSNHEIGYYNFILTNFSSNFSINKVSNYITIKNTNFNINFQITDTAYSISDFNSTSEMLININNQNLKIKSKKAFIHSDSNFFSETVNLKLNQVDAYIRDLPFSENQTPFFIFDNNN